MKHSNVFAIVIVEAKNRAEERTGEWKKYLSDKESDKRHINN
jgi:hypothetical protein